MPSVFALPLLILGSYLLGSIPTGVWVSQMVFGFDIRTKGSGNMGSTNVFRVLGTKWGVIVQVVDVLKGLIPALVFARLAQPSLDASLWSELHYTQMIAGLTATLGHVFPVFVGFKGGKGINTAAGMLVGILPIDIGISVAAFLLVFFSTGIISVSSLTASVVLPVSLIVRQVLGKEAIDGFIELLCFTSLITVLVWWAHRANIQRLRSGTENRFEKMRVLRFRR